MKPNQLAKELRRIANRIDNSLNPSREKVAVSIRGLLSHVAGAPFRSRWNYLEPLSVENAKTSQLLWHAMSSLNMNDWASNIDLDTVIMKMKELAATVGVTDISYPLEYAQENYNKYISLNVPGAPDSK